MDEGRKGTMTIHFMDGTKQNFEYTRLDDKMRYSAGAIIQEALNANQLIIAMEDKTLIIPFQNVRCIEIEPPMEKMPKYAVTDVRMVS